MPTINAGAVQRSESVELTIPESALTVEGYAAPGALVIIRDAGVAIGSVVADSMGFFTYSGVSSPGVHEIEVQYTDIDGVESAPYSNAISIQPQQETVHEVFLSPTISRNSKSPVLIGGVVQIIGYSRPGSQVILRVDYGAHIFYADTNAAGYYEFIVDTLIVGSGSHVASIHSVNGPSESERSKSVDFSVAPASSPVTPDIVVSPDQLPPPIPETPGDGSEIFEESVIIEGESVPNAQINIFEDGELIGSIFSDSNGKWSFEYFAHKSPVTLTFEACRDGRCSVLSRSITLQFAASAFAECKIDFKLVEYRIWGAAAGKELALQVESSSSDGIFVVDWGNGVVEEFDHDTRRPEDIVGRYRHVGQYNGVIKFRANDKIGCHRTRYFSVHVTKQQSTVELSRWWWMLIVFALLFTIDVVIRERAKRLPSK